jgi:long-chain acyl-CoA synthetase
MASSNKPLTVGRHAEVHPDKPAVIIDPVGHHIAYSELERRSRQAARLIQDVKGGVALLMENHLRFAEICWASFRSGVYFTPVNVQLKVGEAAFVINDSGARVVVTSSRQQEVARLLRHECPNVARWIMVDGVAPGFESYEAALASFSDEPLGGEEEGSAMIYSSGTTGRPKGIQRPLTHLAPGSTLFGVSPAVADAYGLTGESVALITAPLYHSSGLTRLMMCLGLGSSVVVMERFDAQNALNAIERYRVTHSLWVPTMFIRLLRLPENERKQADIGSMIGATLGSGPCPASVKEAMINWWGPIITETYGGTEGNGMTSISSEEALDHPGSVGRPVFGQIHILDEDGKEVPAGESGTVYFSGGRPFEYHNDPVKTAGAYLRDGWSTLGDVGYLDVEGYLYLTDRVADVIVSGGVNIYPREVEETLGQHPAVDDVAVIGVPNVEFSEEVKAIVVPAVGWPTDELPHQLIAFCREHLANYKCPRSVDLVDALPRHRTGKLLKRELRARYEERGTSPAPPDRSQTR